jgi:hypothetical protein
MLNLPEINQLGLRKWLADFEGNGYDLDSKLYTTTPIWSLLQPYFFDDQKWYWLDLEEAACVDSPEKFDTARILFGNLSYKFEEVSEFKSTDFDIYHTLSHYKDSKIEVLQLAYNGCSSHGPLVMYFIREV